MTAVGPFGIPWWVFSLGALALALVWVFVWPADRAARGAPTLRYFFLRWGHALVWLLLSVSFSLRWFAPTATGLANLVALAALGLYLAFLFSLTRRR